VLGLDSALLGMIDVSYLMEASIVLSVIGIRSALVTYALREISKKGAKIMMQDTPCSQKGFHIGKAEATTSFRALLSCL
jgi:hypothetical protein